MPEEPQSPFDAKEFEAEMQRLAAEAESLASAKPGSATGDAPAKGDDPETPARRPAGNGGGGGSHGTDRALATAIAQMIRPLSVALSSIDQRTKDSNKTLEEIVQKLDSPGETADAPVSSEDSDAPNEEIQKIVTMLSEQKRSENTSQKLFDAMHAEMKGYKDIFLFEALQKPMIQDMLLLYDDLCAIEGQSRHFRRNLKSRQDDGATVDGETKDFANDLVQNLENLRSLFMEVFDRLEVEQIKTGKGKVDKQLQKALSIVQTDDPEQDNMIDKKLRPGFRWRDRVLRPEEVIVKRFSGK